MKIEINKIKVAARIRKKVDNIEELAANIREHGLISPIAVMPIDGGEYQLLAGLRRLRAVEFYGETEIDVKVFPVSDAEAALKIEYSENEEREPFTYSEKMEYAKLIEEIESAKALERKRAGKKVSGSDHTPLGADSSHGETRKIVASKIGMGKTTYDRAKYIAENAPPEIIDELDRNERTIRGTYDELRAKEKPSETQPVRSSPRKKNDPLMEKYKAMEAESIRKHKEFDSLSPEGKIEELQRQLKKERTRAATAESKLARETELRKNAENHLGATIEMQQKQLEAANVNIPETIPFETFANKEIEEPDKPVDLKTKVYDELSKIHELIAGFEITPDRMDALRENFDAVDIRPDRDIHYINESIYKLEKIKPELYIKEKSMDEELREIFFGKK